MEPSNSQSNPPSDPPSPNTARRRDVLAFPKAIARRKPAPDTAAEVARLATHRASPWRFEEGNWHRFDLTSPTVYGRRQSAALVWPSLEWMAHSTTRHSHHDRRTRKPRAGLAIAMTEASAALRAMGWDLDGPDVAPEVYGNLTTFAPPPTPPSPAEEARKHALASASYTLLHRCDGVDVALLRLLDDRLHDGSLWALLAPPEEPADLPPGVIAFSRLGGAL
ncbi:MAG: hypothetical protein ACOZNI_13020 [Myxococcota bacterium]